MQGGGSATLDAFTRALRREAHVLSGRPELTWQQLHNRLQWEEGPVLGVLDAERAHRSSPGVVPWIRTRTPFHESEALLGVFEGHADVVWDCAFSPDGRWIVSAGKDHTLRLWDADSGAVLRTLEGHTTEVRACAFSPDGRRIVSGSDSRFEPATLRVWDAGSGAELLALAHAGGVRDCAFSPDGRWIASAGKDHTLRVWDAESGAELLTLRGHTDTVWACAFSPDGLRIVSERGWPALALGRGDRGEPRSHRRSRRPDHGLPVQP